MIRRVSIGWLGTSSLSEDLPTIGGWVSCKRTRCFLHILSIVAKSVIKQFDLPKNKDGEEVDEGVQALADLADGLQIEEREEYEAQDEGEEDQPLDRWTDLRADLTEERRKEIDVGIQPVRSTLTKVVTLPFPATAYRLRTIVAQVCLRGEKFNHDPPPAVVHHSGCPWTSSSYDASRCLDSLELNIRHAPLRARISPGNRLPDRNSRA